MCWLDVDSILFSLSRSSRIIEMQTSDPKSAAVHPLIRPCAPKRAWTWIPSKACRIWCSHTSPAVPQSQKAWQMMSAEPGLCILSGRHVAFGRHKYLWHTYHIALGIVTRLQRKLLIAVGSLWPCLANPTPLSQGQEQESPWNNCRLFCPDKIAGVFLNHEAAQ